MENNTVNCLMDADSFTLAAESVKILLEKKGLDVRLYNVKDSSSITDYYVNATGRSSTQVGALADEVVDRLSLRGRNALRVEGRRGNNWLLVDFGDVIINVFDPETRRFYDFDRHMPQDGLVDITELEREVDAKFDLNNK